jgi:hypothetical protein
MIDNTPNPNATTVAIKRVAAGQPVSARHTNSIVDAVNALGNLVGPGRQVKRKPVVDATGVEATTRVFFCS